MSLFRRGGSLRQASAIPHADARMRQNLALILALEGKFGEAETVSQQDMSAQAASANVTAIKQMIAQNDSWRDLQTGAAKPKLADKSSPKHPRLAAPATAPTPAAALPGAPLALSTPPS